MSAIKRKLAIFLILFAAGAFLTVWFAVHAIPLGAIVFGTACIGALFFLYKNFVSLQEARLICENAILTVPSAILSCPKGNGSEAVTEAVVSPFGVLVNGRTIGWGKDGRDGIETGGMAHVALPQTVGGSGVCPRTAFWGLARFHADGDGISARPR